MAEPIGAPSACAGYGKSGKLDEIEKPPHDIEMIRNHLNKQIKRYKRICFTDL